MECMRSSSMTKFWPALTYQKSWLQSESLSAQDDSFLSHSAPTSTGFFTTTSCRRAASFPTPTAAFLSGELHIQVRSQSESGALNKIAVKVPRKFVQEIKVQPIAKKCRVRFADECGSMLSSIRVITEPSDYPPAIPVEVLRRHRKAAGMEDIDDVPKPKSTWKVMFKQPASEYVRFRQKLETVHVALENAMIKNDTPKMIGTIKVGNLSFQKRVFLRCTSNHWKTSTDHDAKFQVSASKAFDTFTFDVPLPSNVGVKESNFEFCICYKTPTGEEFWDSNEGENYKLQGEEESKPPAPLSPPPVPLKAIIEPKPLPAAKIKAMYNDAYAMDFENWSMFCSWKELSTDMPYY